MARELKVLFTAAPGIIVWPSGTLQVEATVPSVALYTLAAVVTDAGYPCTVLDPVDYWRRHRTAADLAAVVAGHDVVCLSANSTTWPNALALLSAVTALEPRPLVVVGGLHPSYCDTHVLATTAVDVIVRGEGERTLRSLLHAVAHDAPFDAIPGLSFCRDGAVIRTPDPPPLSEAELAATPLPCWEKLPRGAYSFIPLELSRGCKYDCSFCSIYHQRCWRPAADVERRVAHAAAHLPAVRYPTLMLSDDCFTADPARVRRVADAFQRIAPAVGTGVEARANDVLDPATLAALARMNVEFIQIGVECGYPEGLKRIRKGITLDHAVASTHALHKAGLRAQAKYSYIVGFPWEDATRMKQTLAFAMSLASRYGNHVQVNWHMLVPGSAIYDQLRAEGRVDAVDFDCFPPEGPDLFTRTHPTVDAAVAADLQDYAALLEQAYPWVATLGNVFRSWTRHAHLPMDRITPRPARRSAAAPGQGLSFAGACRDQLPPVLQRAPQPSGA